MAQRADFARAIREANGAMRQEPAWILAPTLAAGFIVFGVGSLPRGEKGTWPSVLVALVLLSLCTAAYVAIEASMAAIWSRVGSGQPVGADLVREVLRYRALPATMIGLTWRCLGWCAVAMIGSVLFVFPLALVQGIVRGLAHPGAGSVPIPESHLLGNIWLAGCVLLWMLLLAQYCFAVPLLGLTRGRALSPIRMSTHAARRFWGAAVLLSFAGCALPLCATFLNKWVVLNRPRPHHLNLIAHAIEILVTNSFDAWLILVRTGIAQQVLEQVPQPGELAETEGIAS